MVVPGLQGRWEWMKPALVELPRSCRTISYSLCGDIGSGETAGPRAGVRQLPPPARCGARPVGPGDGRAVRRVVWRLRRAALCGDTAGTGHVARARVGAGARAGQPNAAASALAGASVDVGAGVRRHAPMRVWPEVRAAFPTWSSRLGFFVRQGLRAASAPMIPSLMAGAHQPGTADGLRRDCARIKAPTLVLTGEDPLDRVVPVASTRSFCTLIHGAESRRPRTHRPPRHADAAVEIRGSRRKVRSCPQSLIFADPPGGSKRCSTHPNPRLSARPSCSRIRTRSTAGRCTRKWCIRARRR